MGERLRERRQAVGLEIKEAAHKLGKSYQYVRQLEEGINSPPAWPLLGEFAALYATSADYLLGVTDDPAPAQHTKLPAYGAEVLEILRALDTAAGEEMLAVARVLAEHEKRRRENKAAMERVFNAVEALGGSALAHQLVDLLEELAQDPAAVAGPADPALRARLLALLGSEEPAQHES